MTEIQGSCEPEFEPVRAAFTANFDQGLEQGASVSITHRGRTVVDLWGGLADDDRPWERDTICNVWSTTKTMAATVMLMLVDQGQIDLEAPVATYWPEFATHDKGGVLVRHVLGHTAGLPGWAPPIAPEVLYDWDACCAALADQATWWEPGTQSGYHALSQGYLEGEIVRRVTGRTLGTYFQEEVAQPLGADFHIGLPESEEARVARMITPAYGLGQGPTADRASLAYRALASAPISGAECNSREWRASEIPAAGGTGNARSVARVHAALANGGEIDGVRLMSQEGVERIFVEQSHNVDVILGVKMRMGTGFGLMSDLVPLSPNPRACFWGGWGGSICLVDLDAELSVAYVMNRMATDLIGDMRGVLVLFAAYAAVGAMS